MGTVQHHAIIVTSLCEVDIQCAHKLAPAPTAIHMSETNGYFSFAVLPDGGKDGWPASQLWDVERALFVKELSRLSVSWVEVGFGELGVLVVSCSSIGVYR